MATVWIRHPRYSVLILVTLIATFYLLFVPHGGPIYVQYRGRTYVRDRGPTYVQYRPTYVQDRPTYVQDSLETRVQRSHMMYDKFLVQREGLIKKWGPDPNDIHLYTVLFAFMKALSE